MNDDEDLKRKDKNKKRNDDGDDDGEDEGGGIFDTILGYIGKIFGK